MSALGNRSTCLSRRRGLVAGGLLALSCFGALPAHALTFAEDEVKAELVERFVRFVEWPEGSLPDAPRPFILCMLGQDGIARYLHAIAKQRSMKGRPAAVRHIASADAVDACNAVWIAATERETLAAIIARTAGKPILTLGDTRGYARGGVHINIQRSGDRFAFEVNLDEANRSRLQLSSKLVRLGTIVVTGEPAP